MPERQRERRRCETLARPAPRRGGKHIDHDPVSTDSVYPYTELRADRVKALSATTCPVSGGGSGGDGAGDGASVRDAATRAIMWTESRSKMAACTAMRTDASLTTIPAGHSHILARSRTRTHVCAHTVKAFRRESGVHGRIYSKIDR